jgi:hypothetical protein
MVTSGEHKSFCVLDFHVNKSVVSVQRHFRTKFGTDPPSGKSFWMWYLQFKDTGCICKRNSTGRPSTEEEAVERVRTSFVRSPRKSAYRASRELGIPEKNVWRVLWKRLQTRPYRLQLLQGASRHATNSLVATQLPASCVSCYGWSTYCTFVMCLKTIW